MTKAKAAKTEPQTPATEPDSPSTNGKHDWYYLSVFVCFAGVVGFYSYYAYLQEELLADKTKKINTNFVLGT
jgi:hypothetical protein